MPTSPFVRLQPLVALLILTATATPAAAQTTYTWSATAATPDWLPASNWTGGGGVTRPGVTAAGLPSDGNAGDVAVIGAVNTGISNGIGIDFATAGGTLTLGAIQINDWRGSVAIGNTSTATAGTLRLNGATVGGVSNALVANTDPQIGNGTVLTLANHPLNQGIGETGAVMTVQLGTTNGVFLVNSGDIVFRTSISEATPGSGFTVQGGFQLSLLQANTFSGPVRVLGSTLLINQDSALGNAPSNVAPGHLVLQSDPTTGPAILDTNAATFEINANRGIAIGPTTGTGDAVIRVQDPSAPNYLPVITYNGVITNNGAGSGRLVLAGGGRLVLGGSNTFTGGTLINGGEVRLRNVNALGTTGTVTITPKGQYDNGFPLPGNLMVEAAGNLERPIVVDYSGTTIRPVTIGTPHFAAAGQTQFSGTIALNNRPVTLQGGNSVQTRFGGLISGGGDLTITATAPGRMVVFAPLAFATPHSYGNLTIGQDATLQLDAGNLSIDNRLIPDTSSITFAAGARLNLNPRVGDNETVNALIGASGVIETVGGDPTNTFNLVIGNGNGSGSFGGTIQQGAGKAVIRLIKTGGGTQTLAGNNTYTGPTEVHLGTLLVNGQTGASSGTGTGSVAVIGATLGGNGRIAGAISLIGTLAPGVDGAGTLTVGGNIALAGSGGAAGPGRLAVSLAAPGTNSSLTIQGPTTTINFGNGSQLRVSRLDGFGAAGSYIVVAMPAGSGANVLVDGSPTTDGQILGQYIHGTGASGSVTIVPSGFALAAGDTFTLSRIDDAVVLNFTPVPEPATTLALAAGSLGLALSIRRYSGRGVREKGRSIVLGSERLVA